MQFKDYQNLKTPIVLGGRFDVQACLHSGSNSSVFLCRDLKQRSKPVALKTLSKNFSKNSPQAKKLRDEMLLSMSVEHPNIVRVYDYVEEPEFIGFSMEYAEGGDLALLLSKYQRLGIAHALDLVSQIAKGLFAIHSAGLIHRDVKPENILIFGENEFKIGDFGIASLSDSANIYEQEELECTPHYVSPELIKDGEVSAKLDIYSLGVVAYEVITGVCPYQGACEIETFRNQLSADLLPPIELQNDCPQALSELVMRLLARDPSQRFENIAELILALEFLKNELSTKQAACSEEVYE